MKFLKFGLVLCLVSIACSNKPNADEKVWKEAAVVHNEMMALAHQLEARLTMLESDTTDVVRVDSIVIWKAAIEAWEQEIVEVPGNEEHDQHKEGEEHHHRDHKVVEVTPEQMLTIQQELKKELEDIQARMASIEVLAN